MNNSSFRTNTLPTKLKVERSMPKWVTEANDRIGPKPPLPPPSTNGGGASSTFRPPALPPKKNQPEPDYEVIEFSGQQYSNEPTTIAMRPKTPDARRPESAMKCTLCGSNSPWVTCDECAQQIFCASCDDMFHKHPKRKTHLRKAIEVKKGTTPLIPPKALTPTAPVAPPRRNKKGMPSPMPLRRDQVIGSTATTPSVSPVPGSQQQQPAAWQDRLGSLRRGLNLGNRPLPETPRTPSDGVSSRSTTPNSKSVFDQIQKPPSITLEKIKTKASATLDRMALLQQRYRQHKQSKPNEKIANGQREQNLPSDQWSNISSPSQFRSGSMSSGINSFDYPDDTPFHFNQQMSMGGMRGQGSSARNMSTSVFNLNQMSQQRHHRDQQSPMWMGGGSQMQQAQSMAQLNCINCHSHGGWNQSHQHSEDWPGAANSNLNRSNMSLNVTHGFYPNPHNQHMMHAPPVFMNMPGMYPYPMGMPVTAMNPGMMGMPSSGRSRVQSRASSRVPSPTHSRKSMQVRSKKRNDFSENELTDDEDSENDDRRSLMSQRSGMANARRTRRLSSVSQALEQDEPRSLRTKAMSSRDRRGPSMPKSVQDDWTSSRRPSIATSNANSNFNSYRKVYSDSPISPDSEASEAPPTRALVQAKIQEKMKESSSKTKSKPLVLSDNEEPPQSPGPKSPFETEEVEYQNGQDLKQSEETTTPIANTIAEDSSSLGPPPSTPEHEWECEFCTFVNEPKTKICSICCKTPKQAPQKASQKQPTVTSASAKVSTSTTTTTTGVTNGIAKLKISQQTEDESEDYTSAAKKKEMEPIDDIWATLDENIQAEAKKAKRNAETAIEYKKAEKDQQNSTSSSTTVVAKESKNKVQKVSTGCGPSPPKEITRELRSTATSPVPQTMATQTYDTVVPKRIEENNLKTISTEMPTSDFQNQSFTPPTRNFSPKEMFMPMMPTEPTTSREAENMALMDRNMRLYRDGPAERYRSSTDIRSPDLSSAVQASRTQIPDYISLQKEAEHYKFTAEELHAALKNCGDTHPIVWLRDNWSKLIQTVQSLATKYGQERIENVIGTISAIEAREALRLHGGNVWQAISECVEQRQRKYLEISAKGNYSREDIVTALTAHHGNMDLALLDLSKTQLKPFLMRVWGSPGGVENESVNFMQPQPLPPSVPKSEISSPIHEFLAANAEQIAYTQDQASYRNTLSSMNSPLEIKEDGFGCQSQANSNKNVLKDLEILIGNMEQVQAKQNSQNLRNMEDMLGNLLAKKPLEPELDSESERIFMKSPIYSNRNVANNSKAGDDVKNFVWQHIQDVAPNLVEQVERDLLEPSPPVLEVEEAERLVEPPPIDPDEFLMEEIIRPNLKHSTKEEEPENEMEDISAMEDFKPYEDRGLLRKQTEEYELKSFKNAFRQVYKMTKAPESSSEEEISEEESNDEEDSQEEISSRGALIRSTINKTADSEIKNSPTVHQSDSPAIQIKTEKVLSVYKENKPLEEQNAEESPKNTTDANSVQNITITNDLQSSSFEINEEMKKDKIVGYKGYTFRFGFNSSRRNRRARNRRSIKREKKTTDSEVEENEPEESTYIEEQNALSASAVLQNQDQTAQNEKFDVSTEQPTEYTTLNKSELTSESITTEEIRNATENLEGASLQNRSIQPGNNKEQQSPKKANRNVKKRSNIPSRSKTKQNTNSENTSQKIQQKKEDVEANISEAIQTEKSLPKTSETENSQNKVDVIINSPNISTSIPELERSKSQTPSLPTSALKEINQSDEADTKPSTSSPRKASQLKKPKARITEKKMVTTKTDEHSSKPSNSSLTQISQEVSTTDSFKAIQSVQHENTNLHKSLESLNTKITVKENTFNIPLTGESNIPQQSLFNEETVLPTTSKKKPTSKIPVKRTTSSTSLKSIESVSTSLTPTPTTESSFNFEGPQSLSKDQKDLSTEDEELFQDVQSSSSEEEEDEPNFYNAIEDITQTPSIAPPIDNKSVSKEDDDNSDQELFSIGSEEPNTLSTRDLMQSPTSENEVLLILENQSSIKSAQITPVSSNKSIDFKYSDPSKQNLSELVEDTQRLIKQMKEEINIDMAAFDSDNEEDYSDDYSYEEYEEEYEDEEEEEGEEEEEEDNSEQFDEEEGTENEEEYSNADLEGSDDDEIHENENLLEDVQEETVQEQIEIDDTEKENVFRSLAHISTTEHASLVVVNTSALNNETNQTDTDLNTVSVVSDGELFGTGGLIDENDTSSPKQDIIGAATSSDPISENDFAIELTNVESDLIDSTIVNGLKLVQTEMEKVLQSESQSSEAMEDNKPSTSKAVQITKENKQVQHLKKTLQNKSQSQRNKSKIPSVTKNKLDNVIIDQKEETKSFQNAKGTDSSNDEASSNLENSSEYISEPLQINTIALVPNAKTKEEQSITEEITSLLETKFIESYNELSKSQSNQNYPVTQTEILEINEPSSSRTSSELNIQEPKLPSVSKSPEPNVSEYDGEIKESIQIYEINNTSSSSSDKIIQQHTENHEDLENTTQLAESNEPSLSSSTDKRVIHNINEQLLQDNLESNNQENNTEDSIVLIPNEASSSLVSALKGLLKNEEPTTSVTQVKDLISASSLTNQIFEAQPFLDSTDFQNGAKQISVTPSTRKQENENVPGTSKDSIPRKSPPKKTVSKIPKPKVNSKPAPTPTRSKSFSAPSPIGVSSVRAIQQELFNKQAQLAKPSVSGFQRPIPPKLVRKKSITDAISKFTQATSEHTVQRSRTQPKIPKIPKKKYHETCFSDDDYQDSSSEEEEPQPVEVRLRKQSAPVFRTYASIKELQLEQPEICAKRLIDEQLVSNMAEAQIAAALVGMRFQQDVSIWAAKECCDLEQAIALLQQECELCMGSYPLNQIVSMLKCTHKCCKECAKNYFTIQITDRSINDCNCPFCKTPELHDPNVLEDENLEYFSNLDIFIKNIVEPEVHELFQRKLRDRTLMQDPNFKWCIQCSSGFFARPKQKRLICPDCGSVTCSQCRKTWEKQHEGLTCEKFQEWKDANDPEVQAKGVAEHLALNGIDCPKCRFKYSLARGGCMHFTCTQCKFEFCYGCGRPFMMGAKCTVSPYCSKLGLHSHHPRSCLFYLRDKEPHTLQNLLLQNNVPFDVDPIVVEGAGGSKSSGGVSSKCPIPLQKETPKGLVDTVCNTDVQKDHAGLCRQHYVEYLANKVSKASIDPLPILDLTDCVQELRRRGLPLPERGPWDTDEIYRDMCSKVIKEKIPL
ncbi:E3 ubiquitin-protein ligase lubel isoform X2 [Eupeodes corollae]|uniref:E3 ubiquitin-protein ligase lubel isoform X2 n=1 Tax=Eupeodes corollae TaxID=290404 RepID=UPI0024921DC2|nr:E3 ubiquitin-protein ligase lubel isoform X2 [Eupeodes corollae]